MGKVRKMRESLVALVAMGILGGCASAPPPPTLQSGPDAEVTVDGLYRVDNSVMELAYMKPGWDLRGYTAMLIDPVTVAYKTDPRGRQRDAGGGTVSGNFALSANQMENFKSLFQEAVVDALSKDGGYRIVDTPGPDVLRITADLIDLIIAVPTAAVAANSTMIGRSAGAVTLVMEIRDSQSGEIIARAADRRSPGGGFGGMVQVSPQAVRADMRRLFESWATILRERLDDLRTVEIDPAQ